MKIGILLGVGLGSVMLAWAATPEISIPARLSGAGRVEVQAVLIPPVDAKRLFGAEVARRYAVVAATVSNRSAEAALLVHGAHLDTSQWALAGGIAAGTPSRSVASVEARLVRGQLLDAQQWSARNWTIRLLTSAGTAAAGYSFAIGGAGAAQGIAAFNGTLVPGLTSLWPDGTTQQLNRLSDFGLQLNKVIPKQSAELIVCFFPLDRFLTPTFQRLYLKSPAAFFAPFQLLFDRRMEREIDDALGPLLRSAGIPTDELRRAVPAYLAGEALDPKTTHLLDFLNHLSLQAVTIVVDGAFSIETETLAPQIHTVELSDLTIDAPARGVIHGAYLTGGDIRLEEAGLYGARIQPLTAEATDSQLPFLLTVQKPVPPGTPLHFTVKKGEFSAQATNRTGYHGTALR